MKWRDERLKFLNPSLYQDKIVSAESGQRMWLPLDKLIYDSSIIGEVKYGSQKKIRLHPNIEQEMDSSLPTENKVFNGSHNLLEVIQRAKIRYNCIFDLKRFPFDNQECQFLMRIPQHQSTGIQFAEHGAILYHGSSIVDQFSNGLIRSCTNNTNRNTRLTFSIPLTRIFTSQLLATFIPTFLLWLFGYTFYKH